MLILCFGALNTISTHLVIFFYENFSIPFQFIESASSVPSVAYPIAILINYILLKKISPKFIMLFGLALGGLSMVFIGPCKFTGLDPMILWTIVALFLFGFGIGFAMIPLFHDMLDDVAKRHQNIHSNLLFDKLSALTIFSIYFGDSILPIILWYGLQLMSFNDIRGIFSLLLIAYALIYGLYIIFGRKLKFAIGRSSNDQNNKLIEEEMIIPEKHKHLLGGNKEGTEDFHSITIEKPSTEFVKS